MIRNNAARMIETEKELADLVCEWFSDATLRKAVVKAGLTLVENNRGALRQCLQLLENKL